MATRRRTRVPPAARASLERIRELVGQRAAIDAAIDDNVRAALAPTFEPAHYRATYADVAAVLGVSPQAVAKKYGEKRGARRGSS